MLDNPKDLKLKELRDLFITVSKTFVEHLENGKVEELKAIQNYMRKITDEIELLDNRTGTSLRDRSGQEPTQSEY
jgi:hypothetical protein